MNALKGKKLKEKNHRKKFCFIINVYNDNPTLKHSAT